MVSEEMLFKEIVDGRMHARKDIEGSQKVIYVIMPYSISKCISFTI